MNKIKNKLQKEFNKIDNNRLELLKDIREFEKKSTLTDIQIKKLIKIKEELNYETRKRNTNFRKETRKKTK